MTSRAANSQACGVSVATEYFYLCCNCGEITLHAEWKLLKYDDEHEHLVPVEPGDYDPICVCPSCAWRHIDDDSNPGIYDGTRADLEAERERLAADPVFADLWADTLSETCATCRHPRDHHTRGGMCSGAYGGDECYCSRFPDAPDFAASRAENGQPRGDE